MRRLVADSRSLTPAAIAAAALDLLDKASEFPVRTAHTDIIAKNMAVAERDVFRTGLRNPDRGRGTDFIAAALSGTWGGLG
jgi:hypothetical protein